MPRKPSEITIYRAPGGQVEVRLAQETVWLNQGQLTQLFGRERSVITKHLGNIFREKELARTSVCAKFAHTAADGKTYEVDHYSLDVIISLGYRVKSPEGVKFRQWATSVLKEHLVRGYTLQKQRFEQNAHELEAALALIQKASQSQLEQTVFGEPAYPSIESKAAHLLYFVIKNHPFSDGNKRIGSLLFVEFLSRNGRLLRAGAPVINDVGLAALALLVAESNPKDKDVMVRLVINMLAEPG